MTRIHWYDAGGQHLRSVDWIEERARGEVCWLRARIGADFTTPALFSFGGKLLLAALLLVDAVLIAAALP